MRVLEVAGPLVWDERLKAPLASFPSRLFVIRVLARVYPKMASVYL